MEEFLRNLNKVRKHNMIIDLKRKNKLNEKRMEMIKEKCKNIVSEYKENSDKLVSELREKVKNLEDEKKLIEKDRDYYKDLINRIPSFIVKLFCKNKNIKMLNKGGS